MTIEELEDRGFVFTVRHHRREIEVTVHLCNTAVMLPALIGTCFAARRADVMEAARQRAIRHAMEERLAE